MIKKRLIKKFVSVAASAVIAVSAVPIYRISPVFAAESFVSMNVDNTKIVIDENQIETSIVPYEFAEKNICTSISENIISGEKIDCEMLDRITITLGISAISGLSTDRLKNINLYVNHTLNGADCSVRDILPANIMQISDTEYEIRYDFITYGTDLSFKTAYFSGTESLAVTHCTYTSNGSDYVKAQAKTPDGENLFVSIRNNIDERNFSIWMKNITMYINSLKDVTGFSRGTMYLLFDDHECGTAHSANYKLDTQKEINGFTVFSISATDELLDVMNTNAKGITWCVMHELSHSYACHTANNTFDTNYNYHDEVHTNVRGITAIQNCQNLQNIRIYDNGASGTYNTIYSQRTPDENDFLFYMAKKMVLIGDKYGWNKLRFFFSADTASSDYDHSYSCETNLQAAAILKDYLNLDVTVTNPEYLKFVNVLHRLYMLCWDHPTFDAESFKQYISTEYNNGSPDDNSGNDLIQRFIRFDVEKPLEITAQPKNMKAEIGSTVSAAVSAVGQNINYQWYIYEPDSSVPVADTLNSPEFSYTLTEENNGRRIYCEITDKYGKMLKTKTVTLGSDSDIIVQPDNVSGRIGDTVSTSVKVNGCGLRYQWYECNVGSRYWRKTRINGDTYSCKLTNNVCGRKIHCIVTDAFGKKLKSRTVTIGASLEITRQPANISAPVGKSAGTYIIAEGEGITYRWFFRNSNSITWTESECSSPYFTCIIPDNSSRQLAYCEITDIFGTKKRTNTFIITAE